MKKKDILKELIRSVHMPSFCDEEGRCDAIEEGTAIDAKECSCCNINHIVKAFNKGIEYQQQNLSWISVEDDLPCNHKELIENEHYTKNVLVVLEWEDDPTEKHIAICCMCNVIGSYNVDWYWRDITYHRVILWSPLPELPKE